mgnify:CR=1 FL=1
MYTLFEEELPIDMQKRIERNSYLQATDKYMLPDFPITEQQRQEILSYRQQLRDMTLQDSNPEKWKLPEKPEWLNL